MKEILKLLYEGPYFRGDLFTLFNVKFLAWTIFNVRFIVKELHYLLRHNCW